MDTVLTKDLKISGLNAVSILILKSLRIPGNLRNISTETIMEQQREDISYHRDAFRGNTSENKMRLGKRFADAENGERFYEN